MAIVVEPTGVIMVGECEVRSEHCTALVPAPLTAVFTSPTRNQLNVCRACLTEMIRTGQWAIRHARTRPHADLAVFTGGREPVLVAEVKRRQMDAAEPAAWAREMRRNLLAHGGLPPAKYFMIALVPTKVYLWVNGHDDSDRPADYAVEVGSTLEPYMDTAATADAPAWVQAESAVTAWLDDLVKRGSQEPWFVDSGLAEAVRGGRIVTPYAA